MYQTTPPLGACVKQLLVDRGAALPAPLQWDVDGNTGCDWDWGLILLYL